MSICDRDAGCFQFLLFFFVHPKHPVKFYDSKAPGKRLFHVSSISDVLQRSFPNLFDYPTIWAHKLSPDDSSSPIKSQEVGWTANQMAQGEILPLLMSPRSPFTFPFPSSLSNRGYKFRGVSPSLITGPNGHAVFQQSYHTMFSSSLWFPTVLQRFRSIHKVFDLPVTLRLNFHVSLFSQVQRSISTFPVYFPSHYSVENP